MTSEVRPLRRFSEAGRTMPSGTRLKGHWPAMRVPTRVSCLRWTTRPRILRANYIPNRGTDGQVVGFFALVQDVTEERQLEATIQELREEVARVQRTRTVGELTAAIAHEAEPAADFDSGQRTGRSTLPRKRRRFNG